MEHPSMEHSSMKDASIENSSTQDAFMEDSSVEEFEELAGLANEGRGMGATEMLRCIGSFLRGRIHSHRQESPQLFLFVLLLLLLLWLLGRGLLL